GDEPEFPPGFTPDDVVEDATPDDVVEDNMKEIGSEKNSKSKNSVVNNKEGFSSDHIGSSIASKFKTCGLIFEVMDKLITVGQTMGYNMEGCMKNIEFIIGTWVPSSTKLLIISGYAPQELSDRKMLWDYFHHLIDSWDGECWAILMKFAPNMKDMMSKLDRFLITEGLLSLFPSMSAICLDRHLSDHRPILLRELNVDYGPSPFRFFHSWSHKNGYDKLVEIVWKNAAYMETNAIVKLKKKLQALKTSIKQWVKDDNITPRVFGSLTSSINSQCTFCIIRGYFKS
nr:RNA-directed DNA polymerase, eukaryota [Tanacetum cinerariifolium]